MHLWLNDELDNLESYFGRVAKNDPTRSSDHYNDFHWWQRGKEERKLRQSISNSNEDDVILYRYITINQFWQIINSKKIALLNPTLWQDPLESPFFNAKIRIDNNNFQDTPFKDRFFAQCFTLNDSSESMWKTYGRGEKLVRLKIKVGALKKIIGQNSINYNSNHFYLGRVVYLNFEDIKDLFQNGYMFNKTHEITHIEDQAKTLLVKRYAYSFEKEVRLIFDSNEHFDDQKPTPKIIELEVSKLEDLISEILLDPNLNDHEISFYKNAWNFVPHHLVKKCDLYSKDVYQLKIG